MNLKSQVTGFKALLINHIADALEKLNSDGHDSDILKLLNILPERERQHAAKLKELLSPRRIGFSKDLIKFSNALCKFLEQKKYDDCLVLIRNAQIDYLSAASHIAVSRFMSLPSEKGENYFFESVKSLAGLRPFVSFSDAEKDIVAAHASLTDETRFALYKSWFERQPKSFLTLNRYTPRGQEVIAVSIVLPLSARAERKLSHGDWNIEDVELSSPDDDADVLLIDTWIVKQVKKKLDGQKFNEREKHHRWAMAMLFHHLALFINSDEMAFSLYVEPDLNHIEELCETLGFKKYKDGDVWGIFIPQDDSSEFGSLLRQNIKAMRDRPGS